MIKKMAILLAIPLIVAILVIALIPTLISTQTGQQFALRLLLLPFPNTTTAQNLQVSWFGPQKIDQISVNNPEKGISLKCHSIELNESLYSLALRGISPSTITVDQLEAHFKDLNALGVSPDIIKILGNDVSANLQSYPEEKYNRLIANIQTPKATAEFDGRFEWDKKSIKLPGKIVFNSPEKYSIQDLQIDLSENAPNQILVQLSGIIHHQQTELQKIFGKQLALEAVTNINLRQFNEAAHPISLSIANDQTSLKVAGNFLKDGSIQFLQNPIFSYNFVDPQTQVPSTLLISFQAPKSAIQPKDWLNASFSGTVTVKPQSEQSQSVIAADFEVDMKQGASGSQLINLHLHNPDAYLKLNGSIDDGILTLRSPLLAEIDVNAWLKQPQLAQRSPLDLIHSSSNPVKLSIVPEGFQVPLVNFDLKNLKVGSLALELGMIVLKREGPLSNIAKHFNSTSSEPFMVWFTPAYLSARNGIATLHRLDLLLMHTYPIAAWGDINLIQDQLQMTIGVPADALSLFYKLPFMKSSEMITLPIIGQIQHPKIDTSKFKLKLSSLAAKTFGGAAGQLIGSGMDLNANSETIPEPTSVVPWANLLSKPENEVEPKKSESSTKDAQIKKVQKKADSLIKKVLPFI